MSTYNRRIACLTMMTILTIALSEMTLTIPNANFTTYADNTITTPVPTQTPSPAPTQTPIIKKGKIYGFVVNKQQCKPLKDVKLKLKGKKTTLKESTKSDSSGLFKFEDLDKDNYSLTAEKKGFEKFKTQIKLEQGEEKGISFKMKKPKGTPTTTPSPSPTPTSTSTSTLTPIPSPTST